MPKVGMEPTKAEFTVKRYFAATTASINISSGILNFCISHLFDVPKLAYLGMVLLQGLITIKN